MVHLVLQELVEHPDHQVVVVHLVQADRQDQAGLRVHQEVAVVRRRPVVDDRVVDGVPERVTDDDPERDEEAQAEHQALGHGRVLLLKRREDVPI